jgi:four helix bundle protein
MATFKNFEEILAWQKARVLCRKIKTLTEKPLFSKDFKLRDQILSSSGSAMDNIAEGFERQGNKEFVYFLYVSKGSCGEVRSQAYRALDFGYVTQEECDEILRDSIEISKMLHGLIESIQSSGHGGHKFRLFFLTILSLFLLLA